MNQPVENGRSRAEVPAPSDEMVRFARGLRHQLGNVLTPIVAFGEMLSSDPDLNEHAREDVAAINEAAVRGTELVERLLTAAGLSRAELSQLTVLDLAELVEEAWPDSGVSARVTLAVNRGKKRAAEQADLLVSTDTRLLLHAINELAENSTRARASLVSISVGVESSECVLRVDDDGTGCEEEKLSNLADPYVSSQHSSARGLGLSVVNGIASSLGGHLVLEGGEGKGLAVELRWPAYGADERIGSEPLRSTGRELDEEVPA